jgi:hypothetical protein
MAWISGFTAIAGLILIALRLIGVLFMGQRFWITRRRTPAFVVPPDLDQSARPQTFSDGTAACTSCDAVVPFESMSIAEDGYFCPGCARRS